MLHKVEFECEVLTPMFLAGADQNDAELRPPSVRGMLRYWYRALLGGRGITNIADLAREESRVFGETEAASPVSVRVRVRSNGEPKEASSLLKGDSPLKYLWYSTTLGDNNRRYLPAGTTFRLSLATTRDTQALERATSAFWMLVHCGGLGTRSRRMAGSFAARLTGKPDDLRLPSFAPGADFKQYFQEQLAVIRQDLPAGSGSADRPPFDALHPQYSYVWLAGKPVREWKRAVETTGSQFRRYRLRRGSSQNPAPGGHDYQTIKSVLQDGASPATVERAAFGLPLTFRFRSTPGKVDVTPAHHSRRASPLWMQVVRLASGELNALYTFFNSDFLPDNSQLQLRANGETFRVAAPQRSIISDFVSKLQPTQLFP